jgi:hypothetical protein
VSSGGEVNRPFQSSMVASQRPDGTGWVCWHARVPDKRALTHHVRERHRHLAERHAGADVADRVEQGHLQPGSRGQAVSRAARQVQGLTRRRSCRHEIGQSAAQRSTAQRPSMHCMQHPHRMHAAQSCVQSTKPPPPGTPHPMPSPEPGP